MLDPALRMPGAGKAGFKLHGMVFPGLRREDWETEMCRVVRGCKMLERAVCAAKIGWQASNIAANSKCLLVALHGPELGRRVLDGAGGRP